MESPSPFVRRMSRRMSNPDANGSDKGKFLLGGFQRRSSFSLRTSFNTAKYSAVLESVKADHEDETDTWEDNRVKLKKYMSTSVFGKNYENFILILSVLSTLEFIHQTYMNPNNVHDKEQLIVLYKMESVFIGFFLFDWVLQFFMADDKLKYFVSMFSIIDICTVVSTIYISESDPPIMSKHSHFTDMIVYFLHILRNCRILRCLRVEVKLSRIHDAVDRYVGEIALYAAAFVLFFAAVLNFLEESQPIKFHTWMYMVWVTITTVGYGDITARSTLGRIATMVMIAVAIISVPKITNELIEKMNLQSVYMRATYFPKSRNSKHVVICGDISSTSLRDFFSELFHEDHENLDLSAVMLIPEPPTVENILLMRDPQFFLVMQYLEGSALLDTDLRRAMAETAVSIFIMTNKFSKNPDEEDAKSILLSLSIKRYLAAFHLVRPSIFYCLQLIRPENRRHLTKNDYNEVDENDIVVCLNEIKMGMMAKAVMYPGATTLLMNLVTSFADDEEEEEEEEPIELTTSSGNQLSISKKDWIREYKNGCGWEIYTTRLSKLFVGSKFCELSYALYEKKGVVLFALQITDVKQGGAPRLLLNPSDYVIPDPSEFSIDAFVIAQNKADSDLTLHEHDDTNENPSVNRNFMFNSERRKSSMNVPRIASKDTAIHPTSSHNNSSNIPSMGEKDGREKSPTPKKKQSRWKQLKRSALLERKVQSNSYQEIMHRLEAEHFHENYFVAEKPLDINECTVKTSVLNEYPFINQHLIVVGKGLRNLYDLIRPLRAKYLGQLRYIVLLYPYDIPHDVWQRISVFDSLLIVRGSCLEESQLRRAGIFRAAQVVVLADGSSGSSGTASGSGMEALVDAEAIFTYQHVKRMNPATQVVLEFVNQSNISYLRDETKANVDDPKFTAQFASGSLFTTSLLDSIVCQAYYNPQIIKVINKLISGVDELDRYDLMTRAAKELANNGKDEANTDSDSSSGGDDNSEATGKGATNHQIREENRRMSLHILNRTRNRLQLIRGSCLYQMAIPENLEKRTYGSLYQYLAARGKIPLGLLRGIFANMNMGPKSNVVPYVYTNPDKDTELYSCDRVFVLSTVPERVDVKVDIKDWLLDLQMSKSREHKSESLNSAASKAIKTTELLDKQQKKMEDRLNKFSTDVNKKLSSLLELIDKSARFAPSVYSSPSHDGAEPMYSLDDPSSSGARSRHDSRISNSSFGRSRGNSVDSMNSSEADRPRDDIQDSDKFHSNSDTGTNPSISPSPVTILSSTTVPAPLHPHRHSQPSSAPGVLRMFNLANNNENEFSNISKRPSLTIDGIRIIPIQEHSQENSISKTFPEEASGDQDSVNRKDNYTSSNSYIHGSNSSSSSSSVSNAPSSAGTPDIMAKTAYEVEHQVIIDKEVKRSSTPTVVVASKPVVPDFTTIAATLPTRPEGIPSRPPHESYTAIATASVSEKDSVSEPQQFIKEKLFTPVHRFAAPGSESESEQNNPKSVDAVYTGHGSNMYVSSTDGGESDRTTRLMHPKASRPKSHHGPRISDTAEKSTERQSKLRTLREKDPERLDAQKSRKAHETAVIFSEFMASKLRQTTQSSDLLGRYNASLPRPKTAPSAMAGSADEVNYSDIEKN